MRRKNRTALLEAELGRESGVCLFLSVIATCKLAQICYTTIRMMEGLTAAWQNAGEIGKPNESVF